MNVKEIVDARNREVRKANELIQRSRFSLSTQQQKIILYLISKINIGDKEFEEYSFDIIDFCSICGVDHKSGDKYKDIKDAIKGIRDKSLWLTLDNGKSSLVSWIEKARIDEGNGIVQIRLDNDLKPYLLQLKSNYTQYQLIYTLHFRSKYSIRLYEWIMSIHYHELESYTCTCSIDELRERLGGETYVNYKDFKSRVLNPAVKEINEFSDKNISYVEIKHRRKIAFLSITISTKEPIERLQVLDKIDEKLGPEQLRLYP